MVFKVQDHYFKKAKKENYLARSVYKLQEIDDKFTVLSKDNVVLDLGYSPGSWMQYTSKKIGDSGKAVGIDIKEINSTLASLPNVTLFQKDIDDVSGPEDLGLEDKADVVLSDMAPNTTGMKSVDQLRSLNLIEMVFYLLPKLLNDSGNVVVKVFDSNDAQTFLKEQRKLFETFKFLKPKSTRSVSKEFFVIGKGYKGGSN